MKIMKKLFSFFLALMIITTIHNVVLPVKAISYSDYQRKYNELINNDAWKDGNPWGPGQRPKLEGQGAGDGIGCNAYVRDFSIYIYGVPLHTGYTEKFYDASAIRAGDIVYCYTSESDQHWLFVLERDGERLYTAEGNNTWRMDQYRSTGNGNCPASVLVTWDKYVVRNGALINTYYSGGKNCNFNFGYHYDISGAPGGGGTTPVNPLTFTENSVSKDDSNAVFDYHVDASSRGTFTASGVGFNRAGHSDEYREVGDSFSITGTYINSTINLNGEHGITLASGTRYDYVYYAVFNGTKYYSSTNYFYTTGNVAVTGVTLNKFTMILTVGSSATLKATVSPAEASNKNVTWSSSDTSVATVSNGTVTGRKAGTAKITVRTNDGGKTSSCIVTVTDPTVAVTSVSLNKSSMTLTVGGSETLTATVTPSNATNKSVTWTSSDTSVATVSNGKVTAKKAGTATITVKTASGGKTATCKVTVKNPTVAVTGVSLNKTTMSLEKGKTEKLTATVAPSNATNKGVTWSSSNTKVATVSSDGTVTAVAAGTAVIKVTTKSGSKTASCTVTVKNPAVKTQSMYRMYNPNSGEHFYTAKAKERDALKNAGWKYEGIGWYAPVTSKTPVYRLYNENAGDHHYTKNKGEKDALVKSGWKYEGIGWYSDDNKGVPVYRQYNPHAYSCNHNYTTNKKESDMLVSLGWKYEGVAWYGVKK